MKKPLVSIDAYSLLIRRHTIVALFSDNYLSQNLVLKGGNALRIAHEVSTRASKDIDFSIISDFKELADVCCLVEKTLQTHFSKLGFMVFDVKMIPRPKKVSSATTEDWGGYKLKFTVLEFDKGKDKSPEARRILASHGDRVVEIDISKSEYTGDYKVIYLDDFPIQVTTLEVIALEKMRALCQQLPAYLMRKKHTARARDFYDVSNLLDRGVSLLTPKSLNMLKEIFGIKSVSRDLLLDLPKKETLEFHRPDWSAVISSLPPKPKPHEFEHYHSIVGKLAHDLHSRWEI